MSSRRFFLEAVTLIAAAIICALVANAMASRERKLAVVSQNVAAGPPARVPAKEPAPTQTIAPPPVTTTTRQPDIPTTTTTTAPPAPGTRHAAPKPALARGPFNPHPDKPYIEIHGDDVEYLHSKGVLFLDARRTSVYEQGHVPGARAFSVWESDIDEKVNKLYAERSDPKDQNLPIVIYCSGGDCEDSHMLAQKLWGIQFNNIYVYKDGFPDWQKRGLPIHTGSNP